MKGNGIEHSSFDVSKYDMMEKFSTLNKRFDSKIVPIDGCYKRFNSSIDGNVANWLNLDKTSNAVSLSASMFDVAKQMYSGTDGNNMLTLKEISERKINPKYKEQNIKQHAGFAAEVISTSKENMLAEINNTGLKTYRADERPDLYKKNDPYVDKIRINAQGEVVERIQTKFVGGSGKECLAKLASKKYDKYFNDGKVDKIEIPKEYYDEIKDSGLISKKISDYEKQLSRVTSEGKMDVAEKIETKIDRYKKIDQMIERSTVSRDEAIYATKHPKRYVAKLSAPDVIKTGHEVGKQSGLQAVGITVAITTVDNVQKMAQGEITVEEAVVDIVKDTGTAGAVAYGSEFISSAVSQTMSKSSHALIKAAGNSGIPAAVVSFGVDSYDSISDYAQGAIDEAELLYDLGESAANVAGSMAGAAVAGAVAGSVIPGAGTVVGAAAGTVVGVTAGIVGGMVGCAVASEAYATAVEVGSKGAELLANKAKELADSTIELAEKNIPDKVNNIKAAFNDFAKENSLPFSV